MIDYTTAADAAHVVFLGLAALAAIAWIYAPPRRPR